MRPQGRLVRRGAGVFACVLLAAACGAEDSAPPDPTLTAVLRDAGIPVDAWALILDDVVAAEAFDEVYASEVREEVRIRGVRVRRPRSDASVEHALAIQHALRGSGYGAWVLDLGIPELSLIRGIEDGDAFLDLVRTDGSNQGLSHAEIRRRIRRLYVDYGIEIIGGGMDWFVAGLLTLPPDVRPLAAEIAAFCPDVVHQGVGTVGALAADITESRVVFCWWD